MKKILPLFFISAILLVSSCTQDYVCQCDIKYEGNPPGLPEPSQVEFKIRNKKKEAAKQCEANSTTSSSNGITFIETCRLY